MLTEEGNDAFLDVVAEASLRLAGADDSDLDEAIEHVLGAIGAHEGAHRAYITTVLDGGRFTNTHEWVAHGEPSHRDVITDRSLDEFPWSSAKLIDGKVWHCPDLSTLPPEARPERDSFGAFDIVSVLQVPMRNGGRLVGALGFNHAHEPREWTAENIERLRRLSDAIGFALLRRQANCAVAAARDEAERANRAKSVLLANVSHELITPLHAILGFAELLEGPTRTADEHEALRQIAASGVQLLGLVEELLLAADRATTAQAPIE